MSQPTPRNPDVASFFHADTNTFTYVVHAGDGSAAAIIDPVLDFDPAAAATATRAADRVLAFVREHRLAVRWILETHAHADHLSAAGYLHDVLGAPVAIGGGIVRVQARFKALFGLGDEFVADGRQFDRLLVDGDVLELGDLQVRVLATPGHTDDSLTYVVGDAAFVGDTVFAPETGTARTDFPGGDAARLYGSIRRILSLPAATRIFLCHDYPAGGRDPSPESSVAAQAAGNVHARAGIAEADFIAMRRARDATLPPPRLILPSLQVNIRGGRLPPPDANGIAYLRLPIGQLGAKP
jgi:glyoxylase-like metal-dependent hydrolase (beta-lactamase superfamily II)